MAAEAILRFLEARFDLPALGARDANADPLLDLFDFSKKATPAPPDLPEPPIEQARLDRCKAEHP